MKIRKVYIHPGLRELVFGTDDEVGIRTGGFDLGVLEFSDERGWREGTGCLGRGWFVGVRDSDFGICVIHSFVRSFFPLKASFLCKFTVKMKIVYLSAVAAFELRIETQIQIERFPV